MFLNLKNSFSQQQHWYYCISYWKRKLEQDMSKVWTAVCALTFLWLSDRKQVSLPGGELCETGLHLCPYGLETADEGRLGMEDRNTIRNKELF